MSSSAVGQTASRRRTFRRDDRLIQESRENASPGPEGALARQY
jgi:hypothetical protein